MLSEGRTLLNRTFQENEHPSIDKLYAHAKRQSPDWKTHYGMLDRVDLIKSK